MNIESDAELGFVPDTPPVMAEAATRTVWRNALDVDDARMLLQMLGLPDGREVAS
ncbi:hypothetical protein [Rhodococcus xishaensis]|uniref:hypothetical protein n=1 Tax=Rhodococcus xishaensis TaxID=2487364 RepID=UPI0013E36554|nr:hypothetical protein [Rhodococcus xishaensis]